ncbi:MAG: hypothetical protein H0S85_04535 [Desulfovibrionaceae bacterium]|jgi:hypothetical protein|nr:hypothetical protein [Desulfovibrionaceae bacterium]
MRTLSPIFVAFAVAAFFLCVLVPVKAYSYNNMSIYLAKTLCAGNAYRMNGCYAYFEGRIASRKGASDSLAYCNGKCDSWYSDANNAVARQTCRNGCDMMHSHE